MSQAEEPRKLVPLESGKQPLSPALKSWLDNVIVPALVQIWLAEHTDKSPQPSDATMPKAKEKAKTDLSGPQEIKGIRKP